MTSIGTPSRKPRDFLEVSSTALRAFQCISAIYIYISVSLALSRIISVHDARIRSIQPLMIIALTYSTLAILILLILKKIEQLKRSSWHLFIIASLPADMLMLGLIAAQHVIFSIRSFECAAVSKAGNRLSMDEFNNGDLNIPLVLGQPEDGSFSCLFPRGVYTLCITAFFSYLIIIMINVARLLQYRKTAVFSKEHTSDMGLLEAQTSQVDNERKETPQRSSTPASMHSVRSMERRALPQRPPPPEEPKYANMPADMVASMVIALPRVSQESTSTFDPDTYLVSDGFQSPYDPPAYSSRPESLRSLPMYSSRPPSLFAVVP